MLSRRSLLRAIPALLAAPAIVRASSLMPLSVPRLTALDLNWGDLLRVEDVHQAKLWLDVNNEWHAIYAGMRILTG